MPGKTIPERAPVSDPFSGVVAQAGEACALALTAPPGAAIVASGTFVLRYGVRFLGKLEQYIVPGLVVLDYGDMLAGEEAWNFLWHRSNLYPRSEVVGLREDGQEDVVFFRNLDLSIPPRVLVYDGDTLLAQVSALIAADTAGLPPRLVEFLPRYASVEKWMAAK
ncbi:MAG: hypothetical protein HZC41_20785 [Chloroflexi bacterium]|nr:hypothetical protein [Chloroflexota bacterium]